MVSFIVMLIIKVSKLNKEYTRCTLSSEAHYTARTYAHTLALIMHILHTTTQSLTHTQTHTHTHSLYSYTLHTLVSIISKNTHSMLTKMNH